MLNSLCIIIISEFILYILCNCYVNIRILFKFLLTSFVTLSVKHLNVSMLAASLKEKGWYVSFVAELANFSEQHFCRTPVASDF